MPATSMKLYFENQTGPTFDDVTDDVTDYAIYSQIYCSIVRYYSSGICVMYCARSRDRCHALLRNSDVINRGVTTPKVKNSKCSDRAENWYGYVLEYARHDGGAHFTRK